MAFFLIVFVFIVLIIVRFNFTQPSSLSNSISKFRLIADVSKILENQFEYYNNLSTDEKKIFVEKVILFMIEKKFIGANSLKITLEMKVLISASACQVSFGLDKMFFSFINTIAVHEDAYQLQNNGDFYKGHFNAKGIIFLSWKHFLEGYNDKSDKINLGIHEMSHALYIHRRVIVLHNKFAKLFFDNFFNIAAKTFFKLKKEDSSLIREYGKTSFPEFLSSINEIFFEKPEDLKNINPELYKQLCIFLNQDPLLKHYKSININDYFTKTNQPEASKLSQSELILAPSKDSFEIIKDISTIFIILVGIPIFFLSMMKQIQLIPYFIFGAIVIEFLAFYSSKNFRMYDIQLFNEYLVLEIKNIFYKKRIVVHYENIFSISISTDKGGGYVLKYLDNQNIKFFKFDLALISTDMEKIKAILDKRNIQYCF